MEIRSCLIQELMFRQMTRLCFCLLVRMRWMVSRTVIAARKVREGEDTTVDTSKVAGIQLFYILTVGIVPRVEQNHSIRLLLRKRWHRVKLIG